MDATSLLSAKEWYLTHTNRPLWRRRRNVRISKAASEDILVYTYQYLASASQTIQSLALPKDGEFEVLASGKLGRLEDWMIETDFGISDSSGEVRPDWRPTWLLLLLKDSSPAKMQALEVLLDKATYSNDTVQEITASLSAIQKERLPELSKLFEVTIDNGRKEDDQRAKLEKAKENMRSSPQTGIWRAEDEDGETEESSGVDQQHKRGNCICM